MIFALSFFRCYQVTSSFLCRRDGIVVIQAPTMVFPCQDCNLRPFRSGAAWPPTSAGQRGIYFAYNHGSALGIILGGFGAWERWILVGSNHTCLLGNPFRSVYICGMFCGRISWWGTSLVSLRVPVRFIQGYLGGDDLVCRPVGGQGGRWVSPLHQIQRQIFLAVYCAISWAPYGAILQQRCTLLSITRNNG